MDFSYCPICGYGPRLEPYKSVEELRGSYDICVCCGCEYGYDDTPATFEGWKHSGYKWFSPKAMPPQWNLDEQLTHVIRPWPPETNG